MLFGEVIGCKVSLRALLLGLERLCCDLSGELGLKVWVRDRLLGLCAALSMAVETENLESY